MTLTMDLFLLVATFAVGMGTVAYRSRARMSGWPVGGLYTSDAGILQVLGFIAWIGAAYLGFSYLGLWSGVIVVLGGFVLGGGLQSLLRSSFQYLGLLSIPLLIVSVLRLEVI